MCSSHQLLWLGEVLGHVPTRRLGAGSTPPGLPGLGVQKWLPKGKREESMLDGQKG